MNRSSMLMRCSKWVMAGVAAGILAFGTGCGTTYCAQGLPSGSKAAPDWGPLKVFATDNVPFEYEEIGLVSASAHQASSARDESKLCAMLREKAISMGADAIINLRYEVYSMNVGAHMSGVAVKIKKP